MKIVAINFTNYIILVMDDDCHSLNVASFNTLCV